jgi:hypothetical protein
MGGDDHGVVMEPDTGDDLRDNGGRNLFEVLNILR